MQHLVESHPWWVAVSVVFPLCIAGWIMTGGTLLEKWHGRHMFGAEAGSAAAHPADSGDQ